MKKNLEDVLLEENLMDEPGLRRLRHKARREKVSLATAAVESGVLTAEALCSAMARRLHLTPVSLEAEIPDDEALREVPHELASSRLLFPISLDPETRALRIAMADPLDLDAIEEIEESSGLRVHPMLGRADELTRAIRKHYRGVVTKMIPRDARAVADEGAVTSDVSALDHGDAETQLLVEALIDQLVDRGLVDRAALASALGRLRRT